MIALPRLIAIILLLTAAFLSRESIAAEGWFFASARAIDGDTLAVSSRDVGDITIRLAGIDAVEDRQRCGPGTRETAEWSCGLSARLHLVRLFEERGFLRCRLTNEEQGGLPAAMCMVRGGNSLSYEMVFQGLAMALPQADPTLHRAQEDARTNRRGIWQGPFDAPWDWRRDHPGS